MGSGPSGTTAAATGPLRVGILLDSLSQPAWVARALEDVLASSAAEVVLVVRRAQSAPFGASRGFVPRLLRAWRRRQTLLYALYTALDKRLFRVAADAFRPVDVESLLEGCPVVDVTPREVHGSDYFSDSDVEDVCAALLEAADER